MYCPDIIATTIKNFSGEADGWLEAALKANEFCPVLEKIPIFMVDVLSAQTATEINVIRQP